jgi:dienelactone hydrolase
MLRLLGRIAMSGVILLPAVDSAAAQGLTPVVESALQAPIQVPAVTAFQLQRYLMKGISTPQVPASAEAWKTEEQRLRTHILEDIVFHGWPQKWVEAPPHFEQIAVIETGKGYRLRKYRYEIVPGFQSTAILYEPMGVSGRMPAILNVLGHGPTGNAQEYEQKRCINFAKRGILALSLSWIGYGELAQAENDHDYTAELDLVGSSAVGFFYLSMRRGLDFLADLPQADPARLGVTGLSGGGWQTTFLGALDQRVAVSVEVAGFGSQQSNLIRPGDTSQVEESPTDFTYNEDYTYLVAMRAPRPTLLIHNAEDDCCFRATLVKPYIYDQIRPFFKLFGDESALAWHENRDPGTHNYQLDNREQAYAFFAKYFHLPASAQEIVSDAEVRTPQELAGGLPANNLTVAGLAKDMAAKIVRSDVPTDSAGRAQWAKTERERLQSVVRYRPVSVENAWRMADSKHLGLQTISYRFDFTNELSATGVWLEAISSPADAPATIVLNDKGYQASAEMVSTRVSRGEQVLALDTIFNGYTSPDPKNPEDWQMMVTTNGQRPLGLEVAQLLAAAKWLKGSSGQAQIRVETQGIRTQVVALIAAASEPELFSGVVSKDATTSLSHLLGPPLLFRDHADLYCLDLYKYFDIDRLTAMAAPTKVEMEQMVSSPAKGE